MSSYTLSKIIPSECLLGESPIWHSDRQSWIWTDILGNCVYELPFGKSFPPKKLPLTQMVTNISVLIDDKVLVTSESSIAVLSLNTGEIENKITIPHAVNMRCNDGVIGPDGALWFGTMKKDPDENSGQVLRYDLGKELSVVGNNIGIPNTFVWLSNNEILISDSYSRTIYIVKKEGQTLNWENKRVWAQYSAPGTPDGGILDKRKNLLIAVWGQSCVQIRNESSVMSEIKCPMPHVTACTIGGPESNYLFVTSARHGLTNEELKLAPDSGNCLIFKLG